MSDTHIAPARGGRMSNAERKAANSEKVHASVPKTLSSEMIERAARQAAKTNIEVSAPTVVTVRVLKAGDGKVSMGQHVSGVGEVHFERGERFKISIDIAMALEDRGFVEIEGDDHPV